MFDPFKTPRHEKETDMITEPGWEERCQEWEREQCRTLCRFVVVASLGLAALSFGILLGLHFAR